MHFKNSKHKNALLVETSRGKQKLLYAVIPRTSEEIGHGDYHDPVRSIKA
jgi:hypothetical protein